MNKVNKSLANEARTTLLASEDFMLKAKIFTVIDVFELDK